MYQGYESRKNCKPSCNSAIKRGAPKNKGRFALQVEGRFALSLQIDRKI
jgi:hypothetical protein